MYCSTCLPWWLTSNGDKMNELAVALLREDIATIKQELKQIIELLKELQTVKPTAKKKGVQNESN
jgi:hypothetical protein